MFCTLPMLAGPGTDTFNCDNLGIAFQETKSGSWTGPTGAVYVPAIVADERLSAVIGASET